MNIYHLKTLDSVNTIKKDGIAMDFSWLSFHRVISIKLRCKSHKITS